VVSGQLRRFDLLSRYYSLRREAAVSGRRFGAGTVAIWDEATYDLLHWTDESDVGDPQGGVRNAIPGKGRYGGE
jgi:hypothetical protein